jgi:hypothetical protein
MLRKHVGLAGCSRQAMDGPCPPMPNSAAIFALGIFREGPTPTADNHDSEAKTNTFACEGPSEIMSP